MGRSKQDTEGFHLFSVDGELQKSFKTNGEEADVGLCSAVLGSEKSAMKF